jgi:hypothetical protein
VSNEDGDCQAIWFECGPGWVWELGTYVSVRRSDSCTGTMNNSLEDDNQEEPKRDQLRGNGERWSTEATGTRLGHVFASVLPWRSFVPLRLSALL